MGKIKTLDFKENRKFRRIMAFARPLQKDLSRISEIVKGR